MTLRTLYLIRHGHTHASETGGVAGVSDIPLTDKGRGAVSLLANSLASLPLAERPVSWLASPLARTRETADILRRAIDQEHLELQLDNRLVEMNFGRWEGSTWATVHSEHTEAMAYWAEDWVNRSPPGGECFQQQADRCQAWLADWLATTPGGPVVVVAHGGSIRALLCVMLRWPLADAMRFAIDPAGLCRLDWHSPSAAWHAVALNCRRFHGSSA